MSRSRYTVRAAQTDATDPIINQILPFNATLLQTSAGFIGALATPADIVVSKISHVGAAYDVAIYTYDPFTAGSTSWFCPDRAEFLKGDTVRVSFSNPDLITIGFELIFEEGE